MGVTGDAVRYHLTNHQFSTVALIDDTAELLERVVYGSYGEDPQHSYPADLNRDGAVTNSELSTISHLASSNVQIGDVDYTPEADLDRDGDIDSTDDSMAQAIGVQSRLASGKISDPAYSNTIGYTGHRFDPETNRYHMRFRVYVPELGRFMQTDPAGYVDGMNLYQYVAGMPTIAVDPDGRLLGIIAAGVAIGAAIGGIKSYIESDGDWGETAKGALWGGFVGGAMAFMWGSGYGYFVLSIVDGLIEVGTYLLDDERDTDQLKVGLFFAFLPGRLPRKRLLRYFWPSALKEGVSEGTLELGLGPKGKELLNWLLGGCSGTECIIYPDNPGSSDGGSGGSSSGGSDGGSSPGGSGGSSGGGLGVGDGSGGSAPFGDLPMNCPKGPFPPMPI